MAITAFAKTPNSYLDYSQDWGSEWMRPGDSIQTSTWQVPAGLTRGTETNTAGIATLWVRGGNLDEIYDIVNSIVSVQGREDSRIIRLVIQQR